MEKKLINIPFNGFYNSVHDGLHDDAINDVFSDHETGELIEIPDEWYHHYNGHAFMQAYAPIYLSYFQEYLKDELNIDIQLEFESLKSPKYYNFETDKIYAYISIEDIKKLDDLTNEKDLRDTARARHTSISGFISFHNPDIDTWPKDKSEWCNIKLETLLIAAMKSMECDYIEDGLDDYELMEHAICNGVIDSLLWDTMGDECIKIANEFYELHNKDKTIQGACL